MASKLLEHDHLIARYAGKEGKTLEILRRRTSCVFTDGLPGMYLNGRILFSYDSDYQARSEATRLREKFGIIIYTSDLDPRSDDENPPY